jgi:hypothetical protein
MSHHVPIAFLLLGALAALYTMVTMWDKRKKNTRVRDSVQANYPHGISWATSAESRCESSPSAVSVRFS